MKLDHRRTILVGLAFLSICAFWQMYDSVIPKILTETFRLNETISGAIMALDNILALFLLPLFGALSDRTSTKIGRRMPFILLGTACAAVLMNLLPVLDNRYAAAPSTGKLVGFARARNDQQFFGACHRDVEQPAFLVDLGGGAHAEIRRNAAVDAVPRGGAVGLIVCGA